MEEEVKKETNGGSNMIGLLISFVLILWAGMVAIDFFNVQKGNAGSFCFKRETVDAEDGNVDICTGAGYKIYYFRRKSYTAVEMLPMWVEEDLNKVPEEPTSEESNGYDYSDKI